MYTFGLLLFVVPAILLGVAAQVWIRSTYARASEVPAPMSGLAAARQILQANGLANVQIEQVPGHLSDHYDPYYRALRLSPEVYHGRTLAAVAIAAHETGHALQHEGRYAPLLIRNIAVPAASFGSNFALTLIFLGLLFSALQMLLPLGMFVYGGFVLFQLANLPVEYDASRRAKTQLVEQDIVSETELPQVRRVLHAAALTYLAVTLVAVLTIISYVWQLIGSRQRSGAL